MAKRVVLIVFSVIALSGLVLMLVGFSLGGSVGSIYRENGQWLYRTRDQVIELNNYWDLPDTMNDFDFEALSDQDSIDFREVPLDFDMGKIQTVDIDVQVGYVTLRQGDTPGILVKGPLGCEVENEDGDVYITAGSSTLGINNKPKIADGLPRFFLNGKDITTEYIITLPQKLQSVSVTLSKGGLDIANLEADEGNFVVNAGMVNVQQMKLKDATFETNAGSMEIQDLAAGSCMMLVQAGSIDLKGEIQDELIVECDVGSVAVELARPRSYEWSASAAMGSVSIDGQHITHRTVESGEERATSLYIDVECNVGAVTVDFK